jgi:hypothetical protein
MVSPPLTARTCKQERRVSIAHRAQELCRSRKLVSLFRAGQAALGLRGAARDGEHASRHGRVLSGGRKVRLAELNSNVAQRSGSEGAHVSRQATHRVNDQDVTAAHAFLIFLLFGEHCSLLFSQIRK